MKSLARAIASILVIAPAGGNIAAQSFALSLAGPDELRGGGPGVPVSAVYDCVLTPGVDVGEEGAQGWCLGVAARGLRIVGVTTAGTVGGDAIDGPPGLARCGGGSWMNRLTTGDGNEGAISCVILVPHGCSGPNVTTPAGRPAVVCRITVEGVTPPSGVEEASIELTDGLRGPGQPVQNTVIWKGQTVVPELGRFTVRLSSVPADFLRGDANLDGRLDISDSITILGYLFLGGRQPACLDAADVDDSGDLDITDGHGVNVFLFLGGTFPPAPGPFVCGKDPTPDALTCAGGGCP